MDDIRYGVIGSGMMGIEHMLNVQLFDDAHVTAIADSNSKSQDWARWVAKEGDYSIDVYDDTAEMLGNSDIDAVVVCTPNFTHADVLEPIFETNLHVMVEKPMCTTLDDCLRVERAARKHSGVFQVGMEYRYMPPVARLVDAVRAGTVGRLQMLSIREHRMPFLPKVDNWNRFARNTGGTLVEKCCHFFDLMRVITGQEPVRVYASAGQDVNHLDESYNGETPDILDNAFTTVDFDGGARALLDLCMFAEGSRNVEEISATGDAGKVECFIPESTLVVGKRNPRKIETLDIPVDDKLLDAGFHHGSTYYEHVAFQTSIREGTPAEVDARDGTLAVAMGIAAEISALEGRPVELSELLPASSG